MYGLFNNDLADHSMVGMRAPVTRNDAATKVGDSAGCDWHEPPLRSLAGIYLDLADRTLELGERRQLAIAHPDDLDLARIDELREAVRGEVVRVVARVLEHKFVE